MKSRIRTRRWNATLVLLAFSMSHSIAQTSFDPFKAVCTAEDSVGFNWRDGHWVRVNFLENERFLIQKLDVEVYRSKPWLEQPRNCFKFQSNTSKSIYEDHGCYLVKEFGSAKTAFLAEVCTEYFDGKKPIKIVCKSMTFLPDGNFVSSPEFADISQSPQGGRKDSLALTVGRCSRLTD